MQAQTCCCHYLLANSCYQLFPHHLLDVIQTLHEGPTHLSTPQATRRQTELYQLHMAAQHHQARFHGAKHAPFRSCKHLS